MEIEQGTLLGKYCIIEKIGVGGMADVYKAEDTELGRQVALKLLPPEFARDAERVTRFDKEVCAAAALMHQNIVTLYDVTHVDGYHFYTMDLITGGDLKEKIKQGLSPEAAVNILLELGKALSHAHAKEFVHRDIKPENVLFREDGTAVLTDFGIAKAVGTATQMTKTGMSIGTPHYMSPEQARGIGVGYRSDLYSLGILFYEMLVGSVPYDSEDTIAIAYSHVNDPVPELPSQFRKYQPIVDHLLAKSSADRYVDAATMVRAIEDVQSGRRLSRPSHATKVMKVVPAPSSKAGLKWALGGGALALLFGLIAYLVLLQVGSISMAIGGGGSGENSIFVSFPAQPARSAKVAKVEAVSLLSTSILVVSSRPEGAIVYFDKRNLGKTPLTATNLPAGTHTLRVEKEYYVDALAEVTLVDDQVVKRDYVLEQGRGTITVLSEPPGADVFIDGKLQREQTPVTVEKIFAGRTLVTVHKDRFYDLKQEVSIQHGKTVKLDLQLSGGNLVQLKGAWILPEEAE
ncbi:protein kinase domain-containing protein [Desulfotalea psychrophila]|uniref:non-specific serine/threonine protein kinase n=1 Tax=Desulfotalea psychrophila (strain LSv54 / DSM 12343) TaxID=177439 RepID=Q6AK24_DESPS|nr:PEGA domain-containing protein [Desulfotalea psychrophila]CAG37302.1 related to serine/threonine protein kinase [Desulfotalea psychrophila LSv54]